MNLKKYLTLFSKLPNYKNWVFWCFLALVLKSVFFIYKIYEHKINYPDCNLLFAIEGGDNYLDGIENLLRKGEYYPDFRMPGLGAIYFLLRLFFSTVFASDILGILQLLASAISIYTLALIGQLFFKSNKGFLIPFFLYSISNFVSLYDPILSSESLCTSSLIFSFYFLLKPALLNKNFYFFLSGLFITWSIFLRPVISPIIILYLFYILIEYRAKFFKPSLFLLIPFILIDGAWVTRNFIKYKRIIPLQSSIIYSYQLVGGRAECEKFIWSFGGNFIPWVPGSEGSFFVPTYSLLRKKEIPVLPNYIYTSKFNYDSLVILKNLIHEQDSNRTISLLRKNEIEHYLQEKFNLYTRSIKEEKPFIYHFYSRMRLLKIFLIHSGTMNLYFYKIASELNPLELIIKIFYSLLYLFVLTLGAMGICWIAWFGIKNKLLIFLLLFMICIYLTLVYPFVFRFADFRYFVTVYPFYILTTSFFWIKIIEKINS